MKQSGAELGAALLSVLLLIALMSVVALGMSEAMLRTLQRAQAIDRNNLISWHITSVEEVGLNGAEALRLGTARALTVNTPGLDERVVVPLGDAVLDGRLREASNCLNLNSLVPPARGTEPDQLAVFAYRVLLETIGFTEPQREELVDTLLDWFDGDDLTRASGAEDRFYTQLDPSYRTPGGRLVNLSELRAVSGYDVRIIEALRPLVCVRPGSQIFVLNLNTLGQEQAALLSVVFSGELELEAAAEFLDTRPLQGWTSVEEFLAEDTVAAIPQTRRNGGLISVQSGYLELEAQLSSGSVVRQFRMLYALEDGSPAKLVHRVSGAQP